MRCLAGPGFSPLQPFKFDSQLRSQRQQATHHQVLKLWVAGPYRGWSKALRAALLVNVLRNQLVFTPSLSGGPLASPNEN